MAQQEEKSTARQALVEARTSAGLSQEALAEAVGVTRNTVSQWERGLATPYPIYMQRLCKLFGKTAKELGLVPDLQKPEQKEPQSGSTDNWIGNSHSRP